MKTVSVHTARPYEVRIERGLLSQTGKQLAALSQSRAAALIADDTVDSLYGDRVEQSLQESGFRVARRTFPHGEKSKNLAMWAELIGFLADSQLTRADTVIALGGGVTGDMAGFAAASYLRGIRLVQLPTTLLAMVDSSVGGKTGVDLPQGKNLVGAFWQPSAVLCDPDALATLPADVLADGTAEVLKYGVLGSEALFREVGSGTWQPEEVIAQCVAAKADYCAADETDKGARQLLNLGHTLGHGVELCSGYGIPHGHAVGVGMIYAARIAHELGLCAADAADEIAGALLRNHLPVSAPYSADELMQAALHDKKRAGDRITLVLPRRIGECALVPVDVSALGPLVRAALR
ncbi:MAG: 3-dehydroquinate synthase [Eubacteriales bacterium]|nr:3-dehydroquinate synthase [Eubacteriales bacterium]